MSMILAFRKTSRKISEFWVRLCYIMSDLVSKIVTKPNNIWYDSSPKMPNILFIAESALFRLHSPQEEELLRVIVFFCEFVDFG